MRYAKPGIPICFALILAACASTPHKIPPQNPAQVVESQATPAQSGGGYLDGDGPGANAPADIDAIPDAVPRSEPLHPYANRQYAALGKIYTPLTVGGNYKERGIASWYGRKFQGQRTSSGENYDMYAMTAAHPTLPIPSYARVTNLANHKSVVVRINDRGPFLHDRIIDLSYTAAHKLGIIQDGSSEVEVESLAADSSPMPAVASTQAVMAAQPESSAQPVAIPLPVAPSPQQAEAVPAAAKVVETVATAVTSVANAAPAGLESAHQLPADGKIYLQLGAFKLKQGAESFLARMRGEIGDAAKNLGLFEKDGLTRVHVGPYASKEQALAIAAKLQSRLGFKPIISQH